MIAAKPNLLVSHLSAPPIPAVIAWSREYKGGKGPLIDLSQAVPGYPLIRRCFACLARRPDNRR
jgi:hypothetical protein